HPPGSRPLAPRLALVGLVPLVSAAEIPDLATLPFADCHCPRQRLASKPGCASGWRLARRQWRGNWGLVWQWPQSSGCRSIISECAPEQIPGEYYLIRQRLRARRPTPAFSGAANGIESMMRDSLRGLRCNALLGDAHKHHHCQPLMPLAVDPCIVDRFH